MSRLKRFSLFVGVVWALAGSFALFELLVTSAFSAVAPYIGTVALSPATLNSTTCVVKSGETGSAAARVPDARVGAWLLGVNVGREAKSRELLGGGSTTDTEAAANIAKLVGYLKVPLPAPFKAVQIANANSEFVGYVESDQQNTAHQLALNDSPETCNWYKLGALWGYAMLPRALVPGSAPVNAPEIAHYARQVSLPEPLLGAMLTATPSNATTEQIFSDTAALTNAVTQHLNAPRK